MKSSFSELKILKCPSTVLEKIKGTTAEHLDHVNFTFNAIFVKSNTSHDTFYFYKTDEIEWTWYFMPNELNYGSTRSWSVIFWEFVKLRLSNQVRLHRCWWQVDVGARRKYEKIEDVDDENGQNRHQHLKVVANTFRLHNLSATNIDVY